ncbi:MAG: SDR family NAD(P)-dependent oxidoreductase [Alphaproteobacteria bacterium]
MSLMAMIKGTKGASGFGFASTAEDVTQGIDLTGKTILITGVNSGLGQESARVLAARGAEIIGAARTKEKAAAALDALGGDHMPVACELSEPGSVRAAVDAIRATGKTLDVMLCNAGIMALPKLEQSHGYELQFFTNHVGHFLLVTGLQSQLAPDGRVVMLSSAAHQGAPKGGIEFDNLSGETGYSAWRAYGQSKMANLLFAKGLAKRLNEGQTANSVHPGVIQTNLGRHMAGWMNIAFGTLGSLFTKSVPQGAATQCYVATNPQVASVTGTYFADCNVAKPRADGSDDATAERLWAKTEEIAASL